MAFDEGLAERVRKRLAKRDGVSEKRMFGGLAFLLNGNMYCGVHERELIVRLDPDRAGEPLPEPHTRVFDLSGRPMRGWLLVESTGLTEEEVLAEWVGIAVDYVSLPKK
jgi:hypothetical protein